MILKVILYIKYAKYGVRWPHSHLLPNIRGYIGIMKKKRKLLFRG